MGTPLVVSGLCQMCWHLAARLPECPDRQNPLTYIMGIYLQPL